MLAGDAEVISAFVNVTFAFDPLLINVRSLLDALIISIW